MTIKRLLISSLLITSNLSAFTLDNGIKLDINKDDNNLYPKLVLPFKYNNKYSSSIEYKTDEQITKDEKIASADISDKDTTIKHKLLRLNFLNYTLKKIK